MSILQGVFIPFISIAFAEFLDKTQLMVLLLASRTKQHAKLLTGVMLGFTLVDGSAILAGSWLAEAVPYFYVKLIAGFGFFLFGVISLKKKSKNEKGDVVMKNPFISGFGIIFLSEWGDKTQIASALLATQYSPPLVFLGTMLALGLLSIIAVYFGKFISKKFEKDLVNKISAVIFLLIGLLILLY